jgi:hypothetical protein
MLSVSCTEAVFEAPIVERVHEKVAGLASRPTVVDGVTGAEAMRLAREVLLAHEHELVAG